MWEQPPLTWAEPVWPLGPAQGLPGRITGLTVGRKAQNSTGQDTCPGSHNKDQKSQRLDGKTLDATQGSPQAPSPTSALLAQGCVKRFWVLLTNAPPTQTRPRQISHHWFTPQIPATAEARQGQSVCLKSPAGSCT